jgi:small subunit ribosomal protein S1
MKQLQTDPWEGVEAKYPVGAKLQGPRHQHHRLRRLRGAGAGRRRPGPRLRNVVDQEERPSRQDRLDQRRKSKCRCSKSIRSTSAASRSASSRPRTIRGRLSPRSIRSAATVEGEVKNITEFGLFIGLDGDIDGMVHLSDLDWNKPGEQAIEDYKKGDMVKAKVLDVDVEKERISLGIKQLDGDPIEKAGDSRRARSSPCTVTEVNDGGIEVKLAAATSPAFIRRSDLARDRAEQRPSASPSRRQGRCAVTSRQGQPQDVSSRSRRAKSPKRRKPWRNTARPTRAPRSATSSARPLRGYGIAALDPDTPPVIGLHCKGRCLRRFR